MSSRIWHLNLENSGIWVRSMNPRLESWTRSIPPVSNACSCGAQISRWLGSSISPSKVWLLTCACKSFENPLKSWNDSNHANVCGVKTRQPTWFPPQMLNISALRDSFAFSSAQHMDSEVETIDTMALRTVTLWCTLIPSPGKEKTVCKICTRLIDPWF